MKKPKNNTRTETVNAYVAPTVECISIRVESGFAASATSSMETTSDNDLDTF